MILVFAGCARDADSNTNAASGDALRWRDLMSAPSKRAEVTAATDGNRIIVAGGFAASTKTVPTVEVFDLKTETWMKGPDLPVAVNHPMSAVVGKTIYVLGGYLGPGLAHPSDRIFALRRNRWEERARMPEPRAAGGAAGLGGLLYVAGGIGPDGLAHKMLVFDPAADRWTNRDGPPTLREHLGVARFGDRLYVVGGRAGGADSNLAAAEAYDVGSDRWMTLPEMPTARGGIAAAATSNGFVVAVGGEGDRAFEEVEAYDVKNDRWLSLPPMLTARHGLGVVAILNRVYTLAGGPQPGFAFSDAVESIDLALLRR
jgi:hypothetical protein